MYGSGGSGSFVTKDSVQGGAAIDRQIDRLNERLDYVSGRVDLDVDAIGVLTQRVDLETARRTEQVNALLERILKLEAAIKPAPPADPPPVASPTLAVEGDRFIRDGKTFQAWATNFTSYALWSREDAIRARLDWLAERNCQIVRFHHWAKDEADGIDSYKPTWAECLKGFGPLDFWMDQLADRKMLAAITVLHRQRLSAVEADALKTPGLMEFLFGPRDAGIVPGELQDTVFLFPEVLDLVAGTYCRAIGERYGNHPALGMVDPLNESWGCRVRGYYPAGERDRTNPPLNARGKAWFDRLSEYQNITGQTDRQMTTPELVKFAVWNGRRVFRILRGSLRAHGVKCPIGTASFFGANPYAAIAEAELGDYINIHVYPENTSEPNPFEVENDRSINRTLASAINSVNIGKPIVVSEWASVYQNGPSKLTRTARYLDEVAIAAGMGGQSGASIMFHYAGSSAPLTNGPAQADVYSALLNPEFAKRFDDCRSIFEAFEPGGPGEEITLEWPDLYGSEVKGKITPSPRFGSQPWAMQAAARGARCKVILRPELIPQ